MPKAQHTDNGKRIKGRLGEELDRFQALKVQMGLSGNRSDRACLRTLMDVYEKRHEIDADTLIELIGYTADDIEHMNQALTEDYSDIWDLLKHGGRLAADRHNRYVASTGDTSLREAHARKVHHMGGREHVAATVARLMAANSQAQHTLDMVYLTPEAVRKAGHGNHATIRQYFADNRDMIDEHNRTVLGIGSDRHGSRHNLLRAKYLQAKDKGTGEQFLARYGMRLVSENGHESYEESLHS